MATSRAAAPGVATTSERSFKPVVSFIICAGVIALAMASLWIGLSGLMNPDHTVDHTGGLVRTLGGFVGFFVVFGLTLVAAVSRK